MTTIKYGEEICQTASRANAPSSRITARTTIGVGLRDTITPPSTVFAAYNAIGAEKEIVVFPYSGHALPTSHTEWQLAEVASVLGD